MNQQLKDEWKRHILSNVVTLGVAAMVFFGTVDTNNKQFDTSAFETAVKRLAEQEDMIRTLQADLMVSNIKILELQALVQRETDPFTVLGEYLDSLKLPAWVKVRNENGDFVMRLMNESYEFTFCKSKEHYIGKTDYDVWPLDLAESYAMKDREVFQTGHYLTSKETVRLRHCESGLDQVVILTVHKFPITLPDDTRGVGGIITQMEYEN